MELQDSLLLTTIKFDISKDVSVVDPSIDSLSDNPSLGSIWMIDPKTSRNPIDSIRPMPAMRIDEGLGRSFYVTLIEVTTGRTFEFHDPEAVAVPQVLRQMLSSSWFRVIKPHEKGQPYIIRGISDKDRIVYYKEWYEDSPQSHDNKKPVNPAKEAPKNSDDSKSTLQDTTSIRPSPKGGGFCLGSFISISPTKYQTAFSLALKMTLSEQ